MLSTKKKGENKYLAIPIDLYMNNDLLKDVENKVRTNVKNTMASP